MTRYRKELLEIDLGNEALDLYRNTTENKFRKFVKYTMNTGTVVGGALGAVAAYGFDDIVVGAVVLGGLGSIFGRVIGVSMGAFGGISIGSKKGISAVISKFPDLESNIREYASLYEQARDDEITKTVEVCLRDM